MNNIFYINPHSVVSGGNKIVYEHCNYLAKHYQKCFIICDDMVPEWFHVNAFFVNRKDALKLMDEFDIIVFHWDSKRDIRYIMNSPVKRKFYLVQGIQHSNENAFKIPGLKFIAISSAVRKVLKNKYSIDAPLVLNCIDHSVFYNREVRREEGRIFAIDIGGVKRVEDIKAAEFIVKNHLKDVQFVYKKGLTPDELAIEFSRADIYVFASEGEGFGLPPLEAMKCGAVVVCTDSKGVDDYAFHNINCLKVPIRNPQAIAYAILEVLNNSEKKEKFREEGIKIASSFSWEASIKNLANIFGLNNKRNDEDVIASIKNIKALTHIKDTYFYGKPVQYKLIPLYKYTRIKGVKRIIFWLSKFGYFERYATGGFDYNKINIVTRKSQITEVINNDGKVLLYIPFPK